MDRNQDGRITKSELADALKSARFYMTGDRSIDVDMLFAETEQPGRMPYHDQGKFG